MAFKLSKSAYQKLVDEDIKAVRASNCKALEREHIVDVLRHSVERYYPEKRMDLQEDIAYWDQYTIGRQAFVAEDTGSVGRDQCPSPFDSPARDGWLAAQDEDEKQFARYRDHYEELG
jgi:hypothetical protein